MHTRCKKVIINALIAAIYIVLVLFVPTSFGIINFRVADIIVPIALLDKSKRLGITAGMVISNIFSPFGLVDVLSASIICILSLYAIPYCINVKLRCIALILITSLIVSAEITIVANLTIVSFFVTLATMLLSQSIATILGYNIMKQLMRLL